MRRLSFLLFALLPATALGWGEAGHRIAAELAERQLTAASRGQVAALLAGEDDPSLAGVAEWADDVRGQEAYAHTRPWHYVNFQSLDCGYVPARDCPDGNCAVGAINRLARDVGDIGLTRQQRTEALKFLVHFVGDVHQPLHAGLRADRGGNLVQLDYQRQGWNLHSIWDYAILASAKVDWHEYAERLAATPWHRDGTAGDDPPLDWAIESCRAIREHSLYPPAGQHVIRRDYLDAHRPLAELRLRQAGTRLARLLNRALDPPRN